MISEEISTNMKSGQSKRVQWMIILISEFAGLAELQMNDFIVIILISKCAGLAELQIDDF